GIAAAAGVVRPGGMILLAASLSEGIGSPSFEKCLRESNGPAAFELRLGDDRFFAIDQWMVQHLCQALRRARVLLYSDGLDHVTQRELFVEPVTSLAEGVARALELLGPKQLEGTRDTFRKARDRLDEQFALGHMVKPVAVQEHPRPAQCLAQVLDHPLVDGEEAVVSETKLKGCWAIALAQALLEGRTPNALRERRRQQDHAARTYHPS